MTSRRTVYIYGAHGHGKVIAEMLLANADVVGGFIDDGVEPGRTVLSSAVLGPFSALETLSRDSWIALGIGSNAVRERVARRVLAAGFRLRRSFTHQQWFRAPRGWVRNGRDGVGSGQRRSDRRSRSDSYTRSVTEHECVVGDFAHLSPGATLGGQARVGRRSHVGLNASVIHLGVVGDDVTIGAGACVVKPVESNTTVVGVPARPLVRRT